MSVPSIPSPEAFAAVLPAERVPLVLAPSSERGWFGGRALVAWDPVDIVRGLDARGAGEALEEAFAGSPGEVAVALVTYEGLAVVVRYAGALAREGAAWRRVGSLADTEYAIELASGRPSRSPGREKPLLTGAASDLDAREYRAAVAEVRERIAAGDVYVLNLTARLRGRLRERPPDAFAALVERAGSDMSAFIGGLGGPGGTIASVSPERFLRVSGQGRHRSVEVCPIKGTSPRGADAASDAASARALHADAKERAELVMVVDMERNDLGRVCAPGTVETGPLFDVVATPYCHQLVARVRGTLSPAADLGALLEAAFPCGSVTGAPKSAAIGIARELERSPRGAYCGTLAVALPGELDSAVLIRTLEDAGDGTWRWGAGCGITCESDPAAEWLELLLKASPVIGDGRPPVALRESCRVSRGRVPLLDRHLARLAAGGCGPTILAEVRRAVSGAAEGVGAGRLGATVEPSGAVSVSVDGRPSTLDVPDGPRVAVVEVAEAPPLPPGAAKPADRSAWDRALAEARERDADQALLALPDGTVLDGATASVWLAVGGRLLTPHAPHAVDGVARALVFDLARGAGVSALETRLRVEDVDAADEVWLSNAVGGMVAARGLSGPVGSRVAAEVNASLA